MLFLLFLLFVGCVPLFWRYLQIYAPSNVLIRKMRLGPPRWSTVAALLALAAALLVALHVIGRATERGAPGWLNLVVLVLAWDVIKLMIAAVAVAMSAAIAAARGLARRMLSAHRGCA